ncbi:hypothetical protein N9231_06195 [Saprospiraceae bacterium]|nr:hypothetical protein [Saprospiraceae bacterium]
MAISELFKNHGHKLLLIFLALFFGANYDNGQVMLLYGLFVGYYIFNKNGFTLAQINDFSKKYIFILAGGLIMSMITSFITMKIPGKVIANKRTWVYVYFFILCLIYVPHIIFNTLVESQQSPTTNTPPPPPKYMILLYFVIGLIPIINVMNILTNSYKCDKIKESSKNITQTFSCEDINPTL